MEPEAHRKWSRRFLRLQKPLRASVEHGGGRLVIWGCPAGPGPGLPESSGDRCEAICPTAQSFVKTGSRDTTETWSLSANHISPGGPDLRLGHMIMGEGAPAKRKLN